MAESGTETVIQEQSPAGVGGPVPEPRRRSSAVLARLARRSRHILDWAKELAGSRELLFAWTMRNVRARYQQSILGWLWAIIQPAMQAAVLTVIFTFFVPVNTDKTPYILFAYVATTPWTFFASSLTDMTSSIVTNMSLVTKIYFPRETLPAAAMLARLIDLAVAAGLLVPLMLYFGVAVTPALLLYIPAILGIQLMLTMGIGLACAAANVFYRDVQSFLTLGIQIWFYASPVIYPLATVPERFRGLYFLNPMAGIIESYRRVLLYGQAPGRELLVAAGLSLGALVAGYIFFRWSERLFADIV
ncbi:MAG: ABC transporter permease [Bryobacterales bacterium]|nr:ABC transporter permease [Bryobacterales bacterium]